MADRPKVPDRYVVARGPHGTIDCAIRTNGKMEAREFLESPACRPAQAPLLALFQTIVNQAPDDDEIGPKVLQKTAIREFIKGQVRIFCFADGTAWVLTHGDLKKSRKTPRQNIARAEAIMSEDLELARLRRQQQGR